MRTVSQRVEKYDIAAYLRRGKKSWVLPISRAWGINHGRWFIGVLKAGQPTSPNREDPK